MKKVLQASLVLVSAIVGVGFISGKEVVTFFAKFGLVGLIFAVIASIIFGITIAYFLLKSNDIDKLLFCKKPQNSIKQSEKVAQNDKIYSINAIFKNLLLVAYVIISAVMISGFRVVFNDFLSPVVVELLIVFLLVSLFFFVGKGEKGLGCLPVIFCAIFGILLLIIFAENASNICVKSITKTSNLFIMCLMLFYVSMNLFTCFSVLVKFGKNMNKKECLLSGIVSGIIICIFLVLSVLVLGRQTDNVRMPILNVIKNNVVKNLYVVVIVLGLLTTLFSTVHGAVYIGESENFVKKRILVLYFSYLISSLGFNLLVGKVYPLLGFFTMLELIIVYLVIKKPQNNKINC